MWGPPPPANDAPAPPPPVAASSRRATDGAHKLSLPPAPHTDRATRRPYDRERSPPRSNYLPPVENMESKRLFATYRQVNRRGLSNPLTGPSLAS